MSISSQIPPLLSIKEYARLQGETTATVGKKCDEGQLVFETITEEGKRGKRYINMVYLQRRAEIQAEKMLAAEGLS